MKKSDASICIVPEGRNVGSNQFHK